MMSRQTEEIEKFREFQLQTANEKQIRQTLLRAGIKRSDPCWCGSGKKYKRCHWREELVTSNQTEGSVV
jgi:methionyl aminopeptidase